jgi:hypothetical protein
MSRNDNGGEWPHKYLQGPPSSLTGQINPEYDGWFQLQQTICVVCTSIDMSIRDVVSWN